MSDFSSFLDNISSFNTSVLLPFINDFFLSTIGITFVAVVAFVVVIAVLARLLKHRF